MMENEIEASVPAYNGELKKEIDSRYKDYKNGKTKTVSTAESKKRI